MARHRRHPHEAVELPLVGGDAQVGMRREGHIDRPPAVAIADRQRVPVLEPQGAAFAAESILNAIATGVKVRHPVVGIDYAAACDMSDGSNDDAVLSIGQLHHYAVPYVRPILRRYFPHEAFGDHVIKKPIAG